MLVNKFLEISNHSRPDHLKLELRKKVVVLFMCVITCDLCVFQKGLSLITRGTTAKEMEYHKKQMSADDWNQFRQKTDDFLKQKKWNKNSTSILAAHSDYSRESLIHSLMFVMHEVAPWSPLTHLLTHSLTYSSTYSLTHSLIHPPSHLPPLVTHLHMHLPCSHNSVKFCRGHQKE